MPRTPRLAPSLFSAMLLAKGPEMRRMPPGLMSTDAVPSGVCVFGPAPPVAPLVTRRVP